MKLIASELARRVGIDRQTVQVDVKDGKIIRESNYLIDTMNPANQVWIRGRGFNPQTMEKIVVDLAEKKEILKGLKKKKAGGGKEKKNSKAGKALPSDVSELSAMDFTNITGVPAEMLKMSWAQVVTKFGAPLQMKNYVDILNTLMSAHKRDVDVQEKRRKLIEKDFVQSHLLQFVDVMINQLFDYPESVIDEIVSEIKADEKRARMNIPERMRKDFTRIIKETKRLINKEIDNIKRRHDEE